MPSEAFQQRWGGVGREPAKKTEGEEGLVAAGGGGGAAAPRGLGSFPFTILGCKLNSLCPGQTPKFRADLLRTGYHQQVGHLVLYTTLAWPVPVMTADRKEETMLPSSPVLCFLQRGHKPQKLQHMFQSWWNAHPFTHTPWLATEKERAKPRR